jgi:SAM-dependent methyltransferase
MRYTATLLLFLLSSRSSEAFLTPSAVSQKSPATTSSSSTTLHALDPVTYLRTEWVSAALATNQTPRSADVALQLGTEDGRIVNFVPRTIRKIITSSAEPIDNSGERPLTVSAERQLTQQAERRNTASIQFSNQPADNLKDTPDASVDVVVSFQAAQRMYENGLDFKQSIREAGRVLKPGGRFLFVESAEVGGESYLEFVRGMSGLVSGGMGDEYNEEIVVSEKTATAETVDEEEGEEEAKPPLFEEVGYDNVDMVLQPHIAGIAIKAMDADMTVEERKQMKSQEEEDRLAEMSFAAFERGNKRRKRKKKKKDSAGMGMGSE